MDSRWDKVDLELVDRLLSKTDFNNEQIRLISKGLQSCDDILDLCIGFGNLAKILVEQGKTVYGIDISSKSLKYAKRKVGDRDLLLVQGDVRQLAYANSKFDGVSCVSGFDFSDLDPITSSIYHALRPGGYFAVTGAESSEIQRIIEVVQSELTEKVQSGALSFTAKELEKLNKVSELFNLNQVKDSSQRVADSLTKNGFRVNSVESFYENTYYFILAQT